jgi:hypothetical protein
MLKKAIIALTIFSQVVTSCGWAVAEICVQRNTGRATVKFIWAACSCEDAWDNQLPEPVHGNCCCSNKSRGGSSSDCADHGILQDSDGRAVCQCCVHLPISTSLTALNPDGGAQKQLQVFPVTATFGCLPFFGACDSLHLHWSQSFSGPRGPNLSAVHFESVVLRC